MRLILFLLAVPILFLNGCTSVLLGQPPVHVTEKVDDNNILGKGIQDKTFSPIDMVPSVVSSTSSNPEDIWKNEYYKGLNYLKTYKDLYIVDQAFLRQVDLRSMPIYFKDVSLIFNLDDRCMTKIELKHCGNVKIVESFECRVVLFPLETCEVEINGFLLEKAVRLLDLSACTP